jgi:peptidyl-dipeptidase Dcp
MRPIIITLSLIICLGINGCAPAPALIEPVNEDSSFDNPLLAPFNTPFGIPSQVTGADGSYLGIIYLDLHSRPGKEGGASMKYFRPQYINQTGTFIHPILLISCNFSNPPQGTPALLSYEEVTTLYHEFDHALHVLHSKTRFPLLSGTATPQDFLELPSQIMENWTGHPEVLKNFARHYETCEVIPDALIAKIEAANQFNQGFKTIELLARFGMPESIYFRHGSTHFQHIFNWSYSAAYYSYLWSGVLDADAFEAFVETGDLFDPDTAERFRKEILEKGRPVIHWPCIWLYVDESQSWSPCSGSAA